MKELDVKFETAYCESCVTKPCQTGCPLNNDITGFIKLMKAEKYKEAYDLLTQTTAMPQILGRVCPHEKQCQGTCVKGVSYTSVEIGALEAFLADMAIRNGWDVTAPKATKYSVAVIGGGPAGLTCAAFLRRAGVGVTIYEKYDYLGGLTVHGIPEFRLPKTLVKQVADRIVALGVNVEYQKELGKNLSFEWLKENFDAVFLGFGANVSGKMNIPGEDLEGVMGGNELLEFGLHPDYAGKTVVVSGGGNVAMDVSRTAKRLGAERVIVVYRRSEQAMPAEKKEIAEAKEEGVEFLFLNNILAVNGDKKVESVRLIKTQLVKKEGESRLSPVNIEGSEYNIACDYVFMAVGSKAEKELVESLGLPLKRGKVEIGPNGETAIKKVFAGGDLAGVTGTVAWACRSGRNAAKAIVKYLEGK